MIVSESVSVRGRRRVREGVEGVDVSGSVYVSVRMREWQTDRKQAWEQA